MTSLGSSGLAARDQKKCIRKGPDNLWALPNGTFLVMECKNGVIAEHDIAKKDVSQLDQVVT
ncbi:hypothetical protein [Zymomonas mobilis]|nr:hypothetical protein [Zymomonas mobilis]MDX5949567.1 hypothetical protein [Zymomonas mobilis subsp. pomaceae]